MTITLRPEHERIIQEQIASGRFRSADEVLDQALSSLPTGAEERPKGQAAKDMVELFAPLRGLDLEFPRNPATGRPSEL